MVLSFRNEIEVLSKSFLETNCYRFHQSIAACSCHALELALINSASNLLEEALAHHEWGVQLTWLSQNASGMPAAGSYMSTKLQYSPLCPSNLS